MLSNFFTKQYQNLNKILISQLALENNHRLLQAFHPEAEIVPVLKSNAYGHGLKIVAPIFDQLKPSFLAVDSLYEAYELSKINIKTPILILAYTHPANFSVKQLNFHIMLADLKSAKALNQYQKNCKIHIFVDTGMCREGVQLNELREFAIELKKLRNLSIVGLASHLADADNPINDSFTKKQIKNYKQALKILREEGINPHYRHISASGAAFKIKDSAFTMIRAGLASYGINPLENDDPDYKRLALKPALSLISTLYQIKNISKGDKVGYNCTFGAKKKMRIGLIALGYYEGLDRRLSNKGLVTINGSVCPILGRVSMNITSVDLSNLSNPQVGDLATVYSSNPADLNSLVNAAKTAKTIPYELLAHLAESVKRVLI